MFTHTKIVSCEKTKTGDHWSAAASPISPRPVADDNPNLAAAATISLCARHPASVANHIVLAAKAACAWLAIECRLAADATVALSASTTNTSQATSTATTLPTFAPTSHARLFLHE